MSRVVLVSLLGLAVSCHRPLWLDSVDGGGRDAGSARPMDANSDGRSTAPADAKATTTDAKLDTAKTIAVCGNGVVEGDEGCDDGNTTPYDGCSAVCKLEPQCQGGACNTQCGDGLVLNEDCDDGNRTDGDGCSSDCKVEPGFTCVATQTGTTMSLPVVYRDFRADKVEFQPGALGLVVQTLGMVAEHLDAEGKPVFTGISGAFVRSRESFANWYRDRPGLNSTTIGQLILWRDDSGNYVNRWGEHGERWQRPYGDQIPMDGNPVYFPVDKNPFTPADERTWATIAPVFSGVTSWPVEVDGVEHNFHFTDELRHWFLFDATKTYVLEFLGDDDVWVFINGTLAVDLGGIHAPVRGSVTLNAASAARFGVSHGSLYELAVFHAERQTTGSSYMLSLSGFGAASSVCRRR